MYSLYDGFYVFVKGAKLMHNKDMTAQSGVILWLKNISKEDRHTAGEEAVQLGELIQSNCPIPDGFVITSLAYFHFLHENNLISKITQLLQTVNYDRPESVMQVATHIQKLILSTKFSDVFTSDLSYAYNKLCGVFTNAPVIISFSHETVENVHGEANLLQKIKHAWTSLFTPEALINRHTRQMNHFQEGYPILIQKMISAEKAGVLLTNDPVTHDRTKIIIEATDETTDHYVVAKNAEHAIVEKHVAGPAQKISDQQILALSELGKKLEKHLYFPQEVHWAVERNTIYIVHIKPFTAQKKRESQSLIANKLPLLLKGIPASQGIATGIAKKVNGVYDMEHIAQGDIVFASDITTLHAQPLKKAAGFVTDRGGRTSPIAIFAREWGIPAVVGSVYATKNIQNGNLVTIDGSNGEIYKGSLTSNGMTKNKTYIFALLFDIQQEPSTAYTDGLLLIQHKPLNPAKLETICGQFAPRPVLYRLSDSLAEDTNTVLGSSGTHRLLHQPETLKQELAMLHEVTKNITNPNLSILLPFVRSVHELSSIKHLMHDYGLSRSASLEHWVEFATPAALILLDEFIAAGIDGIVIDIDKLTMLLLGIDKENNETAHAFDATNHAVAQLLKNSIRTAHKHHIPVTVYGKSLLHHTSLIEKLISWGVTAIAIEPQHIDQTRTYIIDTERNLLATS